MYSDIAEQQRTKEQMQRTQRTATTRHYEHALAVQDRVINAPPSLQLRRFSNLVCVESNDTEGGIVFLQRKHRNGLENAMGLKLHHSLGTPIRDSEKTARFNRKYYAQLCGGAFADVKFTMSFTPAAAKGTGERHL
ncbi:uncharacterized protein EAF01_003875 [Botrytis porri]|uniref:uncharacterized protein n=1 Tax=Botrytis porri TaxID=87229 RepID=UPI0018FFBC06|nr:uncharacterized protein EAF01_003875 [Botrytis porri]KAF7908120.1 hypothetical protein EAF01_003875 [Botrytis porri]